MTTPIAGSIGPALLAIAVGAANVLAQSVPRDAEIRLSRSACFGECPVYTVAIDAEGRVTYKGEKFVRVRGHQSGKVPVSSVAELLETAETIGFFELDDEYRYITNPDGSRTIVTDLPTTVVQVTRNGRTKRVEDYVGAPDALKRFEAQIDKVARTERWIRIDEQTLREMVADGRAPDRQEQADLLRDALQHDDVAVVQALLELGADPNAEYHGGTTPLMLVRSPAAARALIAAGANATATSKTGLTPLGAAAYLPAEVARLILQAGAPPDQPVDADGQTALWRAACAGNADVLQVLLDAGADPRAQPGGLSALECARQAREDAKRGRPLPLDSAPPFRQDFDLAIAALQQAVARRPY
jgi:hypothetical protein